MSRSKLDATQIAQTTFDPALEAVKVAVQSVNMDIELSADDGDSVIPQRRQTVVVVTTTTSIDTSKVSRICILNAGAATTKAAVYSAVDYPLTIAENVVVEICVPTLKITGACIVVLQS